MPSFEEGEVVLQLPEQSLCLFPDRRFEGHTELLSAKRL